MPAKKSGVTKRAPKRVPVKKVSARAVPTKSVAPREPKALSAPKMGRAAADDPLSPQRVLYLTDVFSQAQLAELIGVSPSQTSRWVSGEERPGPTAAPALIDLEHVYSRARLVWGGESARIWLESTNVFLSGARPLDVLLTEGPAQVLLALDAEMWGGAA